MNRFMFRAWDGGKMHYLFDEDIDYSHLEVFSDGWSMKFNNSEDEEKALACSMKGTLMQSTGLCDKNGKEIFEGDVVHIAGYGDCLMGFPFIELYEAKAENDIGEIIGNIYENPELLEATND